MLAEMDIPVGLHQEGYKNDTTAPCVPGIMTLTLAHVTVPIVPEQKFDNSYFCDDSNF